MVGSASAQTPQRQEQGAPIVVDAFGAKGDGVADDTQAIRGAIAASEASGGGIVTFGRRTYLVTDEIRIDPTRTSLRGNRTVLIQGQRSKTRHLLRIMSSAGSRTYGHGTQFIEGIEFAGPGSSTLHSTAIVLSTPAVSKSSRIAIRNVVIRDFETGIEHHDRTYLTQYFSVQIFNTRYGLSFTSGEDAGENTSLFGCSIFNSDTAIFNKVGANVFCYGCSFDYCRQWVVGSGNMQFFGCWFEKHRPERETDYPFDLSGSQLLISGGGIMTAGRDFEKGNACSYFFMLRSKKDQVTIDRSSAWNLRTATGALAGGEGAIEVVGLASVGRLFVPVATKDDAHHNIFGSAGGFEADDVTVPCWLESDGAEALGPHRIAWSANGNRFAEASIEASRDMARNGQRSLRILKGIGSGTPLVFNLLAPVSPGHAIGLRFWWRSALPKDADGQFWIQVFFAQVVNTDRNGRAGIGERVFWGEAERRLSAGQSDWRMEVFNSYDVQEDAPAFCRAPAWATHAHLAINLFSAPVGSRFYIDDLGGFRM